MIKRVVECDYCSKQHPVQYVNLFGMTDIPDDWYTVTRGTEKAKHYCSKICMVKDAKSNE